MDVKQRMMRKTVVRRRSGCLEWTGAYVVSASGKHYGRVSYQGTMWYVHRLTYFLKHGSIDPNLTVNHRCENTLCWNADHLEQLTNWENQKYSNTPFAIRAAATHCKRGHEYTEANIYRTPKGHRECRECKRANYNAWYARHKQDRPKLKKLQRKKVAA